MIRVAALALIACTGVHDEFVIQPALDAGGTVVIADSPVCQTSAQLNMTKGGTSLIAGSASATIRYVGTAPISAVIEMPSVASSNRLANITIYGSDKTTWVVETNHVGRSRFENLFLIGGRGGFHGSQGVANSFSNIRAIGSTGNGLQFDGTYGCYFCDFADTIAESNSGTGIALVNSRGNVFHGGTSESNDIGVSIADNPVPGYGQGGLNTFVGMSFEANPRADAMIDDNQNMFMSDSFAGSATVGSGLGNRFVNDYVGGGASLTIKPAARKTVIDGVDLVGILTDNGAGTVKLNMLP